MTLNNVGRNQRKILNTREALNRNRENTVTDFHHIFVRGLQMSYASLIPH